MQSGYLWISPAILCDLIVCNLSSLGCNFYNAKQASHWSDGKTKTKQVLLSRLLLCFCVMKYFIALKQQRNESPNTFGAALHMNISTYGRHLFTMQRSLLTNVKTKRTVHKYSKLAIAWRRFHISNQFLVVMYAFKPAINISSYFKELCIPVSASLWLLLI